MWKAVLSATIAIGGLVGAGIFSEYLEKHGRIRRARLENYWKENRVVNAMPISRMPESKPPQNENSSVKEQASENTIDSSIEK